MNRTENGFTGKVHVPNFVAGSPLTNARIDFVMTNQGRLLELVAADAKAKIPENLDSLIVEKLYGPQAVSCRRLEASEEKTVLSVRLFCDLQFTVAEAVEGDWPYLTGLCHRLVVDGPVSQEPNWKLDNFVRWSRYGDTAAKFERIDAECTPVQTVYRVRLAPKLPDVQTVTFADVDYDVLLEHRPRGEEADYVVRFIKPLEAKNEGHLGNIVRNVLQRIARSKSLLEKGDPVATGLKAELEAGKILHFMEDGKRADGRSFLVCPSR